MGFLNLKYIWSDLILVIFSSQLPNVEDCMICYPLSYFREDLDIIMQLNKFTDLGIRVLLLLSSRPEEKMTISQLADALLVSKNHLVKVVHFLSTKKWLLTTRGKAGGVKLAFSLDKYPLGSTIRALEMHTSNEKGLINCHEPPCVLFPSCMLGSILEDALNSFYRELDRYTLLDIVKAPISNVIKTSISDIVNKKNNSRII